MKEIVQYATHIPTLSNGISDRRSETLSLYTASRTETKPGVESTRNAGAQSGATVQTPIEVIDLDDATSKSAHMGVGKAPAMRALSTLAASTPDHGKSFKEPEEVEDDGRATKSARVGVGKAPAMRALSTLAASTPDLDTSFKEPEEVEDDSRATKSARVGVGVGKAPAMRAQPPVGDATDGWYLRKRKSVCREYGIEADSGYFRRSYVKAAGLFLMGLFGADVPKTVKIVVEIASMFTT